MSYDHYYSDPAVLLTLAAGSSAVSANAALFAVWVKPGDVLFCAGFSAIVASIEGNSNMTLAQGWPGPDAVAVSAWQVTRGPAWSKTVTIHTDVVDILQRIKSGTPFRPDATGSLQDRAQFDGADAGFIYLRIDQVPFEFYVKQADAAAWAGPEYVRGPTGERGYPGWSPVLAVVDDGERRVHRVADWLGDGAVRPPTGQYIGASGFVTDIADAIDIRGPVGTVTPELTGLVDRAEVAADAAASSKTAADDAAQSAADHAEAARQSAQQIDPDAYVRRDSNGSDFADTAEVLGNLGAGDAGQQLFAAADAAAALAVLGRFAVDQLPQASAGTLMGRVSAGVGDLETITPAAAWGMIGPAGCATTEQVIAGEDGGRFITPVTLRAATGWRVIKTIAATTPLAYASLAIPADVQVLRLSGFTQSTAAALDVASEMVMQVSYDGGLTYIAGLDYYVGWSGRASISADNTFSSGTSTVNSFTLSGCGNYIDTFESIDALLFPGTADTHLIYRADTITRQIGYSGNHLSFSLLSLYGFTKQIGRVNNIRLFHQVGNIATGSRIIIEGC